MKNTNIIRREIKLNNGYTMNVEIHTPLVFRELEEKEIENIIYILRNRTRWFEDDNGLIWGWPRERTIADLDFFKVEMKDTCWGENSDCDEELIGGTLYAELVI